MKQELFSKSETFTILHPKKVRGGYLLMWEDYVKGQSRLLYVIFGRLKKILLSDEDLYGIKPKLGDSIVIFKYDNKIVGCKLNDNIIFKKEYQELKVLL